MRKKEKQIPERLAIRARMCEQKCSIGELAAVIHVTRETLSLKIAGKTDFTITEARLVADYLHSDIPTLFFAHDVAN